MESFKLEHLPSTYTAYAALFRNINNAGFLHKQLLACNEAYEYAFIDASVLVSRLQLLSAIFRASNLAVSNSLKTPNVHSEIVTSLSNSNNIAEAYRRFGIAPSTSDLVVVKVTFPKDTQPEPPSAEAVWAHIKDNIQGENLPLTDENIAQATDFAKVRKYYKLNGLAWLDKVEDEVVKRRETEQLVVSAMALKGL